MSKPDQYAITYMMGMTQNQFENWVDAGEHSHQDIIDLRTEALRLQKELESDWKTIRHYGIALTAAKHLSREIDHTGAPKDMFTFQAIAKNMKVHVSTIDWSPIDSLSVGGEGADTE